MPRLVIQPSARRDLTEFLLHFGRQSRNRDVALRFVTALREQRRALSSLPGTMGRPRPDLGIDVRSFAVREGM